MSKLHCALDDGAGYCLMNSYKKCPPTLCDIGQIIGNHYANYLSPEQVEAKCQECKADNESECNRIAKEVLLEAKQEVAEEKKIRDAIGKAYIREREKAIDEAVRQERERILRVLGQFPLTSRGLHWSQEKLRQELETTLEEMNEPIDMSCWPDPEPSPDFLEILECVDCENRPVCRIDPDPVRCRYQSQNNQGERNE